MCVARQPISRLYPLDTDDANALGGRTQLLIARCELEAHIHGEQEVRSVAGGQARPVRDSEERPRFPRSGTAVIEQSTIAASIAWAASRERRSRRTACSSA